MDTTKEIIHLLIFMIKNHSKYDDEIGYTKKEMDNLIQKYDLLNLDYDHDDAMLLYDEKYITKDKFKEKIREFFDDAEKNYSEIGIIEYIEFLENENLINICMDKMNYDDIKKEGNNWYFYAKDGWEYFEDYFNIDSNCRDDVVKMILNGEGYELFDYDCDNFGYFTYLYINEKNLKYLKTIVQNMKNDFEINQDEIDGIRDLKDVYNIAKNYDLDDLKDGLKLSHSRAQSYSDENEAYEYTTNQIIEHFGLTVEGLKWVKANNSSKYEDTLKIKFKDENSAKETALLLYKIDNEPYDNSNYLIEFSEPYNGWNGDANEYIDEEIQERVSDSVDEKYLP